MLTYFSTAQLSEAIVVGLHSKVKGGEKEMRKMLVTSLMLCMFALLSMLCMPAVYAVQPVTLKSEVFIELNWNWVGFGGSSPFTWIGSVSGDINGDFYVSLVGASFPGKTEKFSETWIIETANGDLTGFDEGTWSFINFKWGANGAVTSATASYSNVVGYDMRYSGTTTQFPVPPGTPVTGTGILILSSK